MSQKYIEGVRVDRLEDVAPESQAHHAFPVKWRLKALRSHLVLIYQLQYGGKSSHAKSLVLYVEDLQVNWFE